MFYKLETDKNFWKAAVLKIFIKQKHLRTPLQHRKKLLFSVKLSSVLNLKLCKKKNLSLDFFRVFRLFMIVTCRYWYNLNKWHFQKQHESPYRQEHYSDKSGPYFVFFFFLINFLINVPEIFYFLTFLLKILRTFLLFGLFLGQVRCCKKMTGFWRFHYAHIDNT